MACNCISEVQKALSEAPGNTALDIPMTVNLSTGVTQSSRAIVATRKRDPQKRIKPDNVFATYCPFCGRKYKEEESENNG